MGNVAIRVEGVSKKYRLGVFRHDTLRDRIANGVASLFGKNGRSGQDQRALRALDEVSFQVNQGEIVGLIGRNGAGKSTLLKVLSRITEPTTGRIELFGRVGSLLEVGTGFHPELSGRENIYLNGSILGMRREEIRRKFDEIVAFAEIEKFLDTPVKRYSSGMYVRLAFSVAAHLESEILLVDEVLAVGDVAFQRKSLGKMGEVANQGRTVIFVSHNMATIQTLCERGIFLRHGRVYIDAAIQETVSEYLRTLEASSQEGLSARTERRGKGQIQLTNILVSPKGVMYSSPLATGHPAQFIFYLSDVKPNITCGFTIYDHHGQPITDFNSIRHSSEDLYDPTVGPQVSCELDELLLVPGRYRLDFAVWSNHELQDHVEAAAFFDVTEGRLRDRPAATTSKWGSALMPHRWMLPVEQ
jgi:lipopolysaccharide transport system ATP-binding protein